MKKIRPADANREDICESIHLEDVESFEEMWIESNQMDLTLPPSLLLECGKLNLPVEIVTGE